jgi:hypothetical protein
VSILELIGKGDFIDALAQAGVRFYVNVMELRVVKLVVKSFQALCQRTFDFRLLFIRRARRSGQ